MGTQLAQIAIDLCGATISIGKLIVDWQNNLSPGGAGWQFTTTPAVATAVVETTDANGDAVLDLDLTSTETVVIAETGIPIAGAGLQLQSIACTIDGQPAGSFDGQAGTYTLPVGPQDIVSCTVINEIGPVDDDVEIIEVLELPPLGDGGSEPPTAGGVLALLGAAAVAALGARRLA